ncbi:hypothetical protein, partial [uncultured Chitinophaga sp.]|uniref:hypothetical protein n=1 Tax=uncultured Chitinophaga sp. TaxID=339340 RepID=UPI0025DBE6E4
MKHRIYTLLILSASLLWAACSKPEIVSTSPRVVQVLVQGSSTTDLDYIYKDSVVGTSIAANGGTINLMLMLAITDDIAGLDIVKKGTADTLQHKPVPRQPFAQTLNIYYDGIKFYDSSVAVNLKGYALSGELDFLLDGQVVASGKGAMNKTVQIPIDKNTTRKIEITKKGETTPLSSTSIQSSPASQTINFFYDGTRIVDNIQLTPPANPANMMITAKFQSIFPYFKNVDVDLVFYVKNTVTAKAVKTDPEIRFTLPVDGSLRSLELPPLPAATGYAYTYDIYEKGTTNVPYTTTSAPFIPAAFPFQKNEGLYEEFTFQAGTSKLWLINDKRNLKNTIPRASYLSGTIVDLSTYFQ